MLPLIEAIFILGSIYVALLFIKLRGIEKVIKTKEVKQQAIPEEVLKRVRGFDVNNSQYERIVSKEQAPIEIELKNLYRDRQFILDELPFLNWFKR